MEDVVTATRTVKVQTPEIFNVTTLEDLQAKIPDKVIVDLALNSAKAKFRQKVRTLMNKMTETGERVYGDGWFEKQDYATWVPQLAEDPKLAKFRKLLADLNPGQDDLTELNEMLKSYQER